MYCTKCGSPNAEDSRFCTNCGTQMLPAAAPPPPAMDGYYPPPRKKRNPVLIAAIVLLCLAVVIVAVVLLATMNPKKTNVVDVSSTPGSSAVLADNSPDISPQPRPEAGLRENYTQILGGGADEVTVMMYICGADLESEGACGTLDINEMLAADLGDNVNVVLETGGCAYWRTPGIIDREVQRWVINDGSLVELQRLGQKPMLDARELSDFITFAAEAYPANRYQLIFWDHGGGSLNGYGYDQHFGKNSMTLDEIATALKNGEI